MNLIRATVMPLLRYICLLFQLSFIGASFGEEAIDFFSISTLNEEIIVASTKGKEKKDWHDFYQLLHDNTQHLSKLENSDVRITLNTARELADILACLASAPLFDLDIKDKTGIACSDGTMQIECKMVWAYIVYLFVRELRIDGGDAKAISALHSRIIASYAIIVKEIKPLYDPNVFIQYNERETAFRETLRKKKSEVKYKNMHDSDVKKEEKLFNIIRARQIEVFSFFGTLEKGFMNLVLIKYRDKQQVAKKVIMDAGYTKEEIPALLDRTVGRNPKTEFLYKVLLPTKKKK